MLFLSFFPNFCVPKVLEEQELLPGNLFAGSNSGAVCSSSNTPRKIIFWTGQARNPKEWWEGLSLKLESGTRANKELWGQKVGENRGRVWHERWEGKPCNCTGLGKSDCRWPGSQDGCGGLSPYAEGPVTTEWFHPRGTRVLLGDLLPLSPAAIWWCSSPWCVGFMTCRLCTLPQCCTKNKGTSPSNILKGSSRWPPDAIGHLTAFCCRPVNTGVPVADLQFAELWSPLMPTITGKERTWSRGTAHLCMAHQGDGSSNYS